eukprot:2725978-Amphidinium_carterae.3
MMAVHGERLLVYPLVQESARKKDVEAVSGLYVGHAARTSTALLLTLIGGCCCDLQRWSSGSRSSSESSLRLEQHVVRREGGGESTRTKQVEIQRS